MSVLSIEKRVTAVCSGPGMREMSLCSLGRLWLAMHWLEGGPVDLRGHRSRTSVPSVTFVHGVDRPVSAPWRLSFPLVDTVFHAFLTSVKCQR